VTSKPTDNWTTSPPSAALRALIRTGPRHETAQLKRNANVAATKSESLAPLRRAVAIRLICGSHRTPTRSWTVFAETRNDRGRVLQQRRHPPTPAIDKGGRQQDENEDDESDGGGDEQDDD